MSIFDDRLIEDAVARPESESPVVACGVMTDAATLIGIEYRLHEDGQLCIIGEQDHAEAAHAGEGS